MKLLVPLALTCLGFLALACRAHVHGSGPGSEVVTIELTSGLT
jgi:hypothetical protein